MALFLISLTNRVIQEKTTKDRIAAAQARIEKAAGAVPLDGSKPKKAAVNGSSEEATKPSLASRTSDEPMIVSKTNGTAEEEEAPSASNGEVDSSVQNGDSTTLENGDSEAVTATEQSAVEDESTTR